MTLVLIYVVQIDLIDRSGSGFPVVPCLLSIFLSPFRHIINFFVDVIAPLREASVLPSTQIYTFSIY